MQTQFLDECPIGLRILSGRSTFGPAYLQRSIQISRTYEDSILIRTAILFSSHQTPITRDVSTFSDMMPLKRPILYLTRTHSCETSSLVSKNALPGETQPAKRWTVFLFSPLIMCRGTAIR